MPRTRRSRWISLLPCSLIAMLLPSLARAEPPQGDKYALLVGVHQYDKNELRDLPYAEADMEALADVLKKTGYKRVVLMTQSEGAKQARFLPEAAKIRTTLKGMLQDLSADECMLVAFAGHGVQYKDEDDSYFCPMDAKLADKTTLVSLGEVYKQLDKCGAGTRLLLADCCRNDPRSDDARAVDAVKLESVTRPQRALPPGGVAAFFSCSAGEKAYENAALKHGVFFHFVIEGLQGKADLDKDGQVDLDELVGYTKKQVRDFVKDAYGDDVRQMPELVGKTHGIVSVVTLENRDTFTFKKGDRVLFLGDSLTEQYQYSTNIELYLTTRFPDWNLTFLNTGIGGDTATGGASRFAAHVLAEKPTALVIDFGMNDAGYGAFDKSRRDNYVKNTEVMVKAAQEASIRVALVSPNAVDVRSKPSMKTYLETQKDFYAPLKDLAEKYRVPFVDQYAVTRTILEKIAADNAPVKPFADGIHTSPAGALLMAHIILVGLKAPAVVSDLEIDAVAKKAGKATRCTADRVEGGPEGVAFERTDEALPLPVQKEWRDILSYLDQLNKLNYYGLKVTGLKNGKYDLEIDGKAVGTLSAADLSGGMNLGNLDSGPLFDQGQEVLKAINEKNVLVHSRFRDALMKGAPGGDEAKKLEDLKKRMDEIDAKQAAIYKLEQPKMHKFELKPAK